MKGVDSLYFFLQCSIKELDEQVLFPVVLGIVEHSQDDIFHKPVGPVLRHLKYQFGKVGGVSLKKIEEVLVGLRMEKTTTQVRV